MPASKDDIRRWFEHGKELGATHLIVLCDTYSYEDFPAYVFPPQNPQEQVAIHRKKEFVSVIELYNLRRDWDEQLAQHRSHNL